MKIFIRRKWIARFVAALNYRVARFLWERGDNSHYTNDSEIRVIEE